MVLVFGIAHIAVGRLADVLSAGTAGFQNGTYLLAGVFGVEVIEQIAERGEIIVSIFAVHAVVDGDEMHIVTGEHKLRIFADLKLISSKSAHILDDPCSHKSLFYKRQSFLHTGTIEVRSGITVIHQYFQIRVAMSFCVSG